MDNIREVLRQEFKDKEARHDYADEFLNSYIALQIKTLRLQRGWSQKELGKRAGMKQSRISAMEQADYESWSVQSLKRLAQAFDIALAVHFESFGEFLGQMTSLSRAALERPSFEDDPVFRADAEVNAGSAGDSMAVVPFRGNPIQGLVPTTTWGRISRG